MTHEIQEARQEVAELRLKWKDLEDEAYEKRREADYAQEYAEKAEERYLSALCKLERLEVEERKNKGNL